MVTIYKDTDKIYLKKCIIFNSDSYYCISIAVAYNRTPFFFNLLDPSGLKSNSLTRFNDVSLPVLNRK